MSTNLKFPLRQGDPRHEFTRARDGGGTNLDTVEGATPRRSAATRATHLRTDISLSMEIYFVQRGC